MSDSPTKQSAELPFPRHLIAPVGGAEFESDPISTSMLIEERRQTRLARQTVIGCALLLSALVVWAAMAPVNQLVFGNGEIMPVGLVQPVEHLEGGLVADVRVKPGDQVAEGDVLVSLDTTTTAAELAKAEARLESLRLTIERQMSLANGYALDTHSHALLLRLYDSQAQAFASSEQYREAQLDVIRADLAVQQAELRGMSPQRQKNREELAILRRQLADFDRGVQAGAISRRARDEIARDKLELEREQAEIASRATSLKASIEQTQARETELLARIRQDALLEVTQLEAERAEVEALIRQLEDRLARQSIVAPISGTVHVVNVRGAGDVIAPADVVLEIVPAHGEVFAQVEIPAERIGGIRVGMDAQVKVLTYDFARFGTVDAVVETISPSSVMTEDGRSVFNVDLRLADDEVGSNDGLRPIQPGMTVIADIATGSKTVLSYLLKPLHVLTDRALTES